MRHLKNEPEIIPQKNEKDQELNKQVIAQLLFRIQDLTTENTKIKAQKKEDEDSLYTSGKNIGDFFSTEINQIKNSRSEDLNNYSFLNN